MKCEAAPGCPNKPQHYVMDAAPGGWTTWACPEHLEAATAMYPAVIVYTERTTP